MGGLEIKKNASGWWWGLAWMLVPLLALRCSEGTPLPDEPSSVVSSSPTPISAAAVSASGGKAFPVLGVETKDGVIPIQNGQRLAIEDGLFAEVFVVPFPPSPQTDVHLFLLRGETAVEDAKILITYDMTDMDHGTLDRVLAREVESGHYAAPLDMLMWGDWVAEAAIRHREFDANFRVLLGVYPWRKATKP
ncbi:MAG: hypothetical protein HYU86_06405 [Chloroflexi bacterium]|nr:hypothetical protein [Chloroflexota bacterium]